MKPISFPGYLDSLEPITRLILQVAQEARLSAQQTYWLRLAVDEVVTNIITHGYADQTPPGSVEFFVQIGSDALAARRWFAERSPSRIR